MNSNTIWIIACIALVAVIGVLLFFVLYNGAEAITERDMMTFLIDTEAVIVRDESVISTSEFSRISYAVREGASVATGESVSTIFKIGYSDELMQSLISSKEAVYNAQIEQLGSTKDSKLDEMNAGITDLRNRISDAVMTDSEEDLLSLQSELNLKLSERNDYLRTKVQETEALRALYQEVSDKEALIDAWTLDIIAERDGIISFYFDGYEQAINTEKLDMLTPDLIDRALEVSGTASWTTDDKTRVCRIADSDHWYIAYVTNSSEPMRVAQGIEYSVDIDGYGTFSGVALDPIVNGKKVINIIEFNSDIGELINARVVNARVSAVVSGIRIMEEAVIIKDGYCYLELIYSESHRLVPIDVLCVEGDFAIVRSRDQETTLGEGVRYWIP